MSEDRFRRAITRIDEANGEDPTKVSGVAKEVLYARRMSEALARIAPGASEALQLAVRAQHLERWKIARDTYPRDRAGYLRWRSELARMHAERVGEILREVGYEDDAITRVQSIVQKKKLKLDEESQTLEDCACLVFLEHELEGFADQHDEAEVVEIIRKTWANKMSPRGRDAAIALTLSPRSAALVAKALAG